MADVTPNRNIPRPAADGREPAVQIIQTIYDAITFIDNDLQGLSNLIDTIVGGTLISDVAQLITDTSINTASIATLSDRVDDNDLDNTRLENEKEDAAVRATVSPITYDVNGNVTFYDNGLVSYQNFTYTDGELISFEQTVNGVTTVVTLVKNIDGQVTDVTVI